ncbi:response regulator [Phormidium sp. CLA17]|uniref:hybrid sensor histidine kinase/response regulator n=1 Tax=Leptolyngbya sp. Cla-17 TaxID=2803751 RepID=UPI00149113D9|nr:response regulator [Leptolyngbya sp. Cla-17]MBM0743770.1 response regulator [Leptolyngbya sp. Cla-17]
MTTILMIDDDLLVRESLKDLLEVEGFQAIAASSGAAGVLLAEQQVPDVILCDVQMPEMDGYQVLHTLQQNPITATIPFIFLTANASKAQVRQGMTQGADDYLVKPCTTEELLAAIATRLAKHAALQSQSEKQLSNLRSSISLSLPHEFRTPLTAILTSAELLHGIADEATPEEILEIAQTIQSGTRKLYRLVQNFLLYAKLELLLRETDRSHTLPLGETHEPGSFITGIARKLAQQRDRAADLHVELGTAILACPHFEVEKVMTELIDNAFKFSEKGTPIQISSHQDLTAYHIEIINQGRGMTNAQIANVGAYVQFERQYYEQQGIGLGLAIAHRLLTLYGGQLIIESIPNQSICVKAIFPIGQEEERE